VLVTDLYDRPVRGLTKDSFRVFEGNAEQTVTQFFSQDSPISIGLVFDASNSMNPKIEETRHAVTEFLRNSTPGDEFFLLKFSDRPEWVNGFTTDIAQIEESVDGIRPAGWTALFDAIYLGIHQMKHAAHTRKVLLILSDGGDNNSRYTLSELLSRAVEADTLIYTICLFQDPQSSEEVGGPDLLANVAQKTGGITFFVKDREMNGLGEVMGTIGVTLHNQYVLGYYPPENGPAGKYRKIKVQLLLPKGMPEMHIYARTGYYAPER